MPIKKVPTKKELAKTAPTKNVPTSLHANLALQTDNHDVFTNTQLALLNAIESCGSITAAAKQVGISYKTAWDRVDAMNNMSPQPLVVRSTGGAKGGGTVLTALGKQVVEGFAALQAEHSAFLAQLGTQLHSVNDIAKFMGNTRIRTSARNQYRGTIARITKGAVNTEIALRISDSVTITAMITNDSVTNLQLKKGSAAIALIKSSWIILSKGDGLLTSARNQLAGQVSRIVKGSVNSDVILDLGDGKSISAMVTNKSVEQLDLKKGDAACALFKASSVILMAE